MISWALGVVMDERMNPVHPVQQLRVQMEDGHEADAILYTDTLRKAQPGDKVWLNTTAVQLRLGTGGVHIVVSFADDEGADLNQSIVQGQGHLMKLRYTPLQRAVLAVEEPDSPYHHLFTTPQTLSRMPVLIGELHSMLSVAATWLHYRKKSLRIVYIMSDGGSLPLAYSKTVPMLKQNGMIQHTITYGHAYGGDLEALNKYTALIAAKHVAKADLAIVTMGPGIAGTGTMLGHTGVETAEIANAVHRLGGQPVLIPRISFADQRKRHVGISHHCLTVYAQLLDRETVVPLPSSLSEEQQAYIAEQLSQIPQAHAVTQHVRIDQLKEALDLLSVPITTMGRDVMQDPAYFLTVAAAAEWAFHRLPA